MKNLVKSLSLALVASSLLFTACEKEESQQSIDPLIVPNFSFDTMTPNETTSDPSSDEINVKTKITANTDMNLRWRRNTARDSMTREWSALICTGANCYDETVVTESLNLTADNEEEIKVTFNTRQVTGEGFVELLVFNPQDSAGTVEIIQFRATMQ